MTTSENPQTGPISIQLPRLFPHSSYQPLSESPNSIDPLSQTNISDAIPPNTNPAVQTDLVRTNAANANRGRSAEAQFKESFDRFYQKYCSNQVFTLMFFSIFAIGYPLQEDLTEFLVLCIFDLIYLVSLLIACCCGKNTMIDSFRLTYKILEYLIAHAMIFSGFNPLYFLMISYLFKAIVAYSSNCSQLVKFTDEVNQIILGIRIGIFAQGILMITSLKSSIPFLVKFFPLCAIILAIILLTANMIKNLFFTYDDDSQFRRTMNENKTGVRWIFWNLFGLIGILVLQVYFLLIDDIEGIFEPWVFIAVILWCLFSLICGGICYNEVFKICETLAIFMENYENMSTNGNQNEIEYVKRVSNTYFRPATEQEIINFTSRTGSIETVSENDLEAGVENSTEEKAKCIVCCRKSANAVFMRCGHGGVCFSCGKKINNTRQKECHMCRQRINAILMMNIMTTNKNNVYEIVHTISNQKNELRWDNINF